MRTEYKLVHFEKDTNGGWLCWSKGKARTLLGRVYYDLVKSEYLFQSDTSANSTQLVSISQFIDQISIM